MWSRLKPSCPLPDLFLAVAHTELVQRVARVLSKDLRQRDHLGIILECLGKIDHGIRRVLLVAVASPCQKSHESGLRRHPALVGSSGSGTGLNPLLSRV